MNKTTKKIIKFGWLLLIASIVFIHFVFPIFGTQGQIILKEVNSDTADRITHYVFYSTGPSLKGDLEKKYWDINQSLYKVLKEYGYPDEAIYRLSEFGATQGDGINGRSTIVNFRKIFHHLAINLKESDHVFIFIVGHGNPSNGDFVHTLIDGDITSNELKELINSLPAKDITIALHSCYSGGFLPKLSSPDRVIVTSSGDQENNNVPWAEALIEALSLKEGIDNHIFY